MSEEAFEARAEVDVPSPEAAQGRFGVLVVMRAELAVLARVFLFSHDVLDSTLLIYEKRGTYPCFSVEK